MNRKTQIEKTFVLHVFDCHQCLCCPVYVHNLQPCQNDQFFFVFDRVTYGFNLTSEKAYKKFLCWVFLYSFLLFLNMNMRVIAFPRGVMCLGQACILSLMKYLVQCHGQTVKCWSYYISIIILQSKASSIIKILVSISIQHDQLKCMLINNHSKC